MLISISPSLVCLCMCVCSLFRPPVPQFEPVPEGSSGAGGSCSPSDQQEAASGQD